MKTLWPNRRMLWTIVIAALLAGCGQSLRTPDASAPIPGSAQRSSTSGPLLYVVAGPRNIQILSLPDYTPVASIRDIGDIEGMCADSTGDVWVVNYRHGYPVVDEFAHGGTASIAQIRPAHGWTLTGCAVDPTSGNLAALALNIYGGASVLIWPGAHKGTPLQYPGLCCDPLFAVYDNDGNLYMSGAAGGDDWYLVLGELAKGSTNFTAIKLNRQAYEPGEVQWDGTYVVVATARFRRTPQLYRVQVAGKVGHVVQSVSLDDLGVDSSRAIAFALYGNTAIGRAHRKNETFLAAWQYPGGGKISQSIGDYRNPGSVVVSP